MTINVKYTPTEYRSIYFKTLFKGDRLVHTDWLDYSFLHEDV